jgi:hypothetical protein
VYEAVVSAAAYASYCGLGLVQALVVLLPRAPRPRWLLALRSHWLLIVGPAAVLTGITFIPSVASAWASSLSTLALVAVPVLAAVGVAWATRIHHAALVLLVLVALSSVALAVVIVGMLPITVAKIGIGVWAAVDLSVALAHRLEEASRPIMQATPVVGPHLQFQRVVLGSASMEYADLFVAAGLGAVLALEGRRRGSATLLLAIFAMTSSLFFMVTDALPATVPIALALACDELLLSRRGRAAPGGKDLTVVHLDDATRLSRNGRVVGDQHNRLAALRRK